MSGQSSPWYAWPAALVLALSAGAAWALSALILRGEASFMAAPAAMAAVLGTGWARPRSRIAAALAAAALTLATAAYALYLWSAALVAGGVGIGFDEALLRTGPGMATALLAARLSSEDHLLIGGSALLAAAVAARRATPRRAVTATID
ncbi:MAG: hypothetical protein ACK558_11275 [Pseudomonadota bacterium]|jgi:hypothetical protein